MTLDDAKAREAVRSWIGQMYAGLNRSTYYHLLQLPSDAHAGQIREAYYRLVARLHPDLYAETLDRESREKLVSIYSRLVEAYRCLSDGARREQYDRGLSEGKLRTSLEDEKRPRRDTMAEIRNEQARRFFKLGQDALRANNGKAAVMNLKLALSQEPSSVIIQAELAKAEALAKKQGA